MYSIFYDTRTNGHLERPTFKAKKFTPDNSHITILEILHVLMSHKSLSRSVVGYIFLSFFLSLFLSSSSTHDFSSSRRILMPQHLIRLIVQT